MRVFIGAMRGSRPCTGAAFAEFGGDTTSLLVLGTGGERLVLDAGTGLHAVAGELAEMAPGEVTVLFSHYHLDHMAGLTMNPLFYRSDWSFNFVGPKLADGGVREAVTRLLAPPYWPVSWERMGAPFEFTEIVPGDIQLGALRLRVCPIPHPGGCRAYRVDDTAGGRSLVFATDLEWRNRAEAHEKGFLALCRVPAPADMLIIDAHFARADEDAFAGWGHTCWEDGLEIAASAGIERVLLGHHDPEADDETLRDRERQIKTLMPGAALARDGQWLTFDS